MSDELKACPFCNSVPMVKQYFIKGVANHINYFVECPCGNRTRSRKSYYGAVSEWNTRPLEDALQARITELEAENAKLKSEIVSKDKKVTDYEKELRQLHKYDKTCSTCRYLDENQNCVFGIRCINYALWQGRIL